MTYYVYPTNPQIGRLTIEADDFELVVYHDEWAEVIERGVEFSVGEEIVAFLPAHQLSAIVRVNEDDD